MLEKRWLHPFEICKQNLSKLTAADLLRSGHLRSQVDGHLALGYGQFNRLADPSRRFVPADVVQHQRAGQDEAAGVLQILSSMVGACRA